VNDATSGALERAAQDGNRPDELSPSVRYARAAAETIRRIEGTQLEAIETTVRLCTEKIAAGGLVHLFGSGHSRIPVEEMFPRYGSFAGFHPIVEHSLSSYHQVVGASGLTQAMFIENVEELGRVILGNFRFDPALDLLIAISSSGANAVPIDAAIEAKRLGLTVVAITSVTHSKRATSRHSSGKRLFEVADVAIDTCTPAGDAAIAIDGLEHPVGPLSTIGAVTVVNMIKVGVAQRLTDLGQPPVPLTSSVLVGDAGARDTFQRALGHFRERQRRL
jgi:uncharacterized phosphosugar-binding protein